MFLKKAVTKKFRKIPNSQSLLFIKVAGLASNFIKKYTLTQSFFCDFCEILKNTFFIENLRATASYNETTCMDVYALWTFTLSPQKACSSLNHLMPLFVFLYVTPDVFRVIERDHWIIRPTWHSNVQVVLNLVSLDWQPQFPSPVQEIVQQKYLIRVWELKG